MKSYTDIEQSKKLVEILPTESADMCYPLPCEDGDKPLLEQGGFGSTPCWSLAALLNVLPKTINHDTLFIETSPVLWHVGYRNIYTARVDNLVDACVEMIIKLHEFKML